MPLHYLLTIININWCRTTSQHPLKLDIENQRPETDHHYRLSIPSVCPNAFSTFSKPITVKFKLYFMATTTSKPKNKFTPKSLLG